jgi:gluconokinase
VGQVDCTIGIDLGTTSVKAAAFDTTGREIAHASVGLALWHDDEGAAEQDPADVERALLEVLAQVAGQARALGHTVARLGLSAAMHSLIPVRDDGAPLARALLWMDQRAQQEARALWSAPAGKALYARTGTPIHAMSPLVKLLWLRTHRPELFLAASRFVSLKEWIWHRWFGEWQVDASIASATGLLNLHEGTWDAEALALAGIAADRLSAIVPTTYVRSGPREPALIQAGVGADVLVSVGASDGVLANLGVGAVDPDCMVLTIGTSCAVRTGSPRPVTDLDTRTFCYVLDPSHFVVGGPSNSGGIVLDWLYHQIVHWRPADQPPAQPETDGLGAAIAAAAQADPGDLLCLPYVTGERAPLWDARARGVFSGLELRHTAADLMRAAVEGIIFNAHWIASPLFEQLGRPREIVATGGALQSNWIRQLTADVFGIPVLDASAVDASVAGAASLANIATGAWTWQDALARPIGGSDALTNPTAGDRYQRKLQRFRQLTTALTTDLANLYLEPGG